MKLSSFYNWLKSHIYKLLPFPHYRVDSRSIVFPSSEPLVHFRTSTLYTKEPDTISWIRSLPPNSTFFDIGANIGIYSLFASAMGHRVVSFEPESQNFALLCKTIFHNKLSHLVTPFCISLHSELSVSTLNLSSFQTGSALSSFSNSLDFQGHSYSPVFQQGSIGMSLDTFVEYTTLSPTHIKIDVDGNEYLVLLGMEKILQAGCVQSLIVELDSLSPNYHSSISLLERYGYSVTCSYLSPITQSASSFSTSRNYHFALSA